MEDPARRDHHGESSLASEPRGTSPVVAAGGSVATGAVCCCWGRVAAGFPRCCGLQLTGLVERAGRWCDGSEDQLRGRLEPGSYLGSAAQFIASALAAHVFVRPNSI